MSNWRDKAACRTEDPELFFPVGSHGPALRQTEQAKAVCGGCPVQAECLAEALATGQAAGIWGNTTETERRAISRRGVHVGTAVTA